jgi:hypothetical protein
LFIAAAAVITGLIPAYGQQGDADVKAYLIAMDNLTAKLAAIVDADTAQSNAPDLLPFIDAVNRAAAPLKAFYAGSFRSDPSYTAAMAANAAAISDAQSALAKQTSRLLTGNCDLRGNIKSAVSSSSLPVTFLNRSFVLVQLYWIDTTGKLILYGRLRSNEQQFITTLKGHVWIATDQSGACVAIMQPTQSGYVSISEVLAPSLGPYLSKIAK